MTVINPFDFFLEPERRDVPFEYDEPAARRSWRRSCAVAPAGPRLAALLALDRPRAPAHTVDFLVDLNRRLQQRRPVRDPHGARRADVRGDARARRSGSCRDSAWLLVETAAPPRARRALRVRLSDPAQARREAARRPAGPGAGLHRPARLGRGLSAGRRLGRPGSRRRVCWPARATSRWRPRPNPESAAPVSGPGRARARWSSTTRCR